MKLLRYGPVGQEKPGLLDADQRLRDLSAHLSDIDAAALAPATLARLGGIDPQSLAAARLAIQTFTPEAQPDEAISTGAPAGGWDTTPAAKTSAKASKSKSASR